MLIVKPSPQIKPPLWAINPGIIAINASRMGLPMPEVLWIWGTGNQWNDLSGQNNNGTFSTVVGGPIWTAQGAYFDGSDCINGPAGFVNPAWSEITIFLRMKCNDSASYVNGPRACYVEVRDDNRIYFKVLGTGGGDDIYSSDNLFVDGETFNLMTIFSAIQGKQWIYKNGVLDVAETATTAGNVYHETGALVLGSRDLDVGAFVGYIEEAMWFKEALSPTQVATLSADPYGLVRQPESEVLWMYEPAVGGVAPTGVFYGPLAGPFSGPI